MKNKPNFKIGKITPTPSSSSSRLCAFAGYLISTQLNELRGLSGLCGKTILQNIEAKPKAEPVPIYRGSIGKPNQLRALRVLRGDSFGCGRRPRCELCGYFFVSFVLFVVKTRKCKTKPMLKWEI
jgi:hypothetical protein